MNKDESSEFKLPGIVGQLANLAERANQAKGYFVSEASFELPSEIVCLFRI
jgi:hypothetical protein